jgi:selenium metabolism protein YedF
MQEVDGKGLLCPQPLILTRKALKNCLPGETLRIECDNRTAYQNIMTYLSDQSMTPKGTEVEGVFKIEVVNQIGQKEAETVLTDIESMTCSSSYVVVVSSDKMGEGDPQLGTLLLKGFLNALIEQPQLPASLVFYNSGVKMTIQDSGVITSLQALEERGVEILVCGTCVEFYGIKDQMMVGKISNMFTITETMAKTGHVVKP